MRDDVSDHFDGKRFFNPNAHTEKTLRDMMRMFGNDPTRVSVPWPERVENRAFPPPPKSVSAGQIAITYVGQATFLLQFDDINILTDPNFSKRASPVPWAGPKRVRPPGVAFNHLPPIHYVLLSHNHYDHMDLPTLRRLRNKSSARIITGLGNGCYLARKGIRKSVELDWWQAYEPRPEVRITYVPAQHWSNRGLFDRRRMLWGGHVIQAPVGRIYFAGDSGYPGYFGEIKTRLGSPNIALLPIGAYEPRWFMASHHMNPDEAVRAHVNLGARLSIGMHFATFRLTDEAIDAPVQALEVALREHQISPDAFRVPEFGETMYWTEGL
jgi:L-ascorbate metabolism protein UlaG (beta-lactamase superfamily)